MPSHNAYDKRLTHTDLERTGTGGPFVGAGILMSCSRCGQHRPLSALEPDRAGIRLKRCKDRPACKTRVTGKVMA